MRIGHALPPTTLISSSEISIAIRRKQVNAALSPHSPIAVRACTSNAISQNPQSANETDSPTFTRAASTSSGKDDGATHAASLT